LVKAINNKDINALKSKLRYDQPFSVAIFTQATGKKLPKSTRDIHSFLDNEFMSESVNKVKETKLQKLSKFMAEGKYPWDKCIADQTKRYGSKETAEKVCGAIKAG
jgi:uncharacterized low-complexity protein